MTDLSNIVRPLEWLETGFDQDADIIDTTEAYQIQEGIFWYGAQVHGTKCADDEAAKAAAQADYARRILSAINLDVLAACVREGLEMGAATCRLYPDPHGKRIAAPIDADASDPDAIAAAVERAAGKVE